MLMLSEFMQSAEVRACSAANTNSAEGPTAQAEPLFKPLHLHLRCCHWLEADVLCFCCARSQAKLLSSLILAGGNFHIDI